MFLMYLERPRYEAEHVLGTKIKHDVVNGLSTHMFIKKYSSWWQIPGGGHQIVKWSKQDSLDHFGSQWWNSPQELIVELNICANANSLGW